MKLMLLFTPPLVSQCFFFLLYLTKILFILGTTMNDRQTLRGNRAQITCHMSFAPYVGCFFLFFFCYIQLILDTTNSTINDRQQQMMGRDGEGEWGAKNTQCVICTLGRLFFSLFLLYLTEFLFILGTTMNDKQKWRGGTGCK